MAVLSFNTIFNFNSRTFQVQDITDYISQGINPANVKGVLKLVTPRGKTYDNTDYTVPDITIGDGQSGLIPLPVNASGYILAGTYSVQYSIQDSGNGNAISTQTNNYTFSFIVPAIAITQVADGYNSLFSSTDSSVYGSYASLVRIHTVTPPSGSPLSPISNNNAVISYGADIWSGVWTSQITSVLIYNQLDGLSIRGTITLTQLITAYNINMDVIRTYIDVIRQRYFTALQNDRDEAYRIKDKILLIDTAYAEYDLALYYNQLRDAYDAGVDIIIQLNDVITIVFPEDIVPFVNQQGTNHPPVSINPSASFGTSIANQQLTFGLATVSNGGMMPALSGVAGDYLGGDGGWHNFVSGDVALKTDFTAYDSVRAITATNISNWNAASNLVGNVYTKTNLQTSGQASVHFDNLTNKPTTLLGYGITNGMVANTAITGATHTKITYDSKGLVTSGVDLSASDIPVLDWSKITTGIPTTIVGYGITNAYTKTEVDAKTWDWTTKITGTPTTLAGYGITDGLSTLSPAASVIDSGLGDQFLADDLTYKYPIIHGVTDKQIIFNDGTATAGNANLTFDKTTSVLSALNATVGTGLINTQLNFTNSGVNIKRTSGDLILTDTHYSKTLSELVSGATNFWIATGSDIYFGTGTDKVGINQPNPTAELDVVGHIIADYFDSNFIRYKNSNILIGPNAGDLETGNNLLIIANTNTATPIIKCDFVNQTVEFNADTYINTIKRLCFEDSTVYLRRDGTTSDLLFSDPNTNSGNPVKLSDFVRDASLYALKSDFTQYSAATSVTNAAIAVWAKASILNTAGSATNFLGEDGAYHAGGSGGVTPTDGIFKFDLGSVLYRPYNDNTEAGGVASDGKFIYEYPTTIANNLLVYNGILQPVQLLVESSSIGPGLRCINNIGSSFGIQFENHDTAGYGLFIENFSTGNAMFVQNDTTGIGMTITNNGGNALLIGNTGTGTCINIQSGNGNGLYIDNTGATTGIPIIVSNGGEVFSVDKDGNTLLSIGATLRLTEGSNATMGVVNLVSGTSTISTTKVTANSRIFITVQGGTITNLGMHYISTRTPGTSFVITSTNILDTSTVAWIIIEPV